MRTRNLILTFLSLLFASSPAWALGNQIQGGNPCQDPSATITLLSGATSGTSAVQLVPAVAGKQVYVCGLALQGVSGTTPTFSLVSGTGTNCGTGQATAVAAVSTVAASFYALSMNMGRSPGALCYKDGGTTPVQNYWLSFIQE